MNEREKLERVVRKFVEEMAAKEPRGVNGTWFKGKVIDDFTAMLLPLAERIAALPPQAGPEVAEPPADALRELVQKWLNEAQRKQVMSHPCAHYEGREIARLAHELIDVLAAEPLRESERKVVEAAIELRKNFLDREDYHPRVIAYLEAVDALAAGSKHA